ncbi:ATP-dependent DNA helicase PIF1 [Hirsutella rhossiliensis]|uniref:ATP-dependent DNA helicase PIF1 n=1 Tax=Hirsutella rhossiliensis TaxID=111463 RepID=A0A9P8MTQ1_9HYPO|nr:ATP-dependent DNA helicase PIF1 [Hirsutella rhossiliensis]KAH0961883.1 ATP-dependent DNA helicase PIF1 [Hirsutella rhossiliensis]
MLCHRKRTAREPREMAWDQWMSSPTIRGGRGSPFACRSCFPEGEPVPVCEECSRPLARGVLSPAAQLHSRLGCEHVFPDELKGLTSVEKLIALNSCYRYPKHVKGHITVFPNDVQGLVAKVLPHPLLRVIDEIHVSWLGAERPGSRGLSGLLSVRRSVVERALAWLKENNPLYGEVEIDTAEMDSWGAPPYGVPAVVCERLERIEPSALERTRTAQVMPPLDRAMDEEGAAEIDEIFAALKQAARDRGASRMVPPKDLTSWLKPPRSAKRKRDTKVDVEAQYSDEEIDEARCPTKASKTDNSAKPKKTAAVGTSQEAKELYADTLKALDKRVDELDKKVRIMSGNSAAITTSSYATSIRKHMGAVKKLVAMDITLAFNLLLSMADASHTDLDATCKMCGTPCDNSIPTFKLLDEALLSLIKAREKPVSLAAKLPEAPKRWTVMDADVGVFKTGRPNKQQRGQMYRQKLMWEKNRRQARRERREKTVDWVKVALNDLVEERDYLNAYGVKEYLPRCIAKLDELVMARGGETCYN